MKKSKKEHVLADCIYDIICGLSLPENQTDEWAKLKRKFEQESKHELKKLVKDKYLCIERNKIQIGERNPVFITINH